MLTHLAFKFRNLKRRSLLLISLPKLKYQISSISWKMLEMLSVFDLL
ncbi:BnaCnng70920D [Brassica napus]|uniref:BnaCnng70920D protein n=1 Tax=Brassica napus TaxID=3708 RepID=A0A078JX68_BRANA|nr:BnaCnng70920D [Brassica napus]